MKIGEKIAIGMKRDSRKAPWLAESLGISASAVKKWTKGEACPSIDKLLPIARSLNIPLEYLLDDECTEPSAVKRVGLPEVQKEILKLARALGYETALERLSVEPAIRALRVHQSYEQILSENEIDEGHGKPDCH